MTDVGTTHRKRLTPRQRLSVWEREKGICCICHAPIDGVREKWIVEHVIALELGGLDDESNMAPAHKACAAAKTGGKDGDHGAASSTGCIHRRRMRSAFPLLVFVSVVLVSMRTSSHTSESAPDDDENDTYLLK